MGVFSSIRMRLSKVFGGRDPVAEGVVLSRLERSICRPAPGGQLPTTNTKTAVAFVEQLESCLPPLFDVFEEFEKARPGFLSAVSAHRVPLLKGT